MTALITGQINYVENANDASKKVIDLYGLLVQLDVLWAGAPAYASGIDQAGLDANGAFHAAGLTTQDLANAQSALSTIKNTITNALPALSVMANAL